MAKVNLGKNRIRVMCQKAALYQKAQKIQDMKVLFVWNKKGATSTNWLTRLKTKFFEREKKINSLENDWNKM